MAVRINRLAQRRPDEASPRPHQGGKPHKYIASDYNPFASRNDEMFTMLFVSKHQGILLSR